VQPRAQKQLGRLLRQRREHLGLTIRQLEELSGVDDSSIVRLENGMQSRPNIDKLDRLAKSLGLPVEDVLATAGLTRPTGLPSFRPYMRARYGQLPASAQAELERYFDQLVERYGLSTDGPAPGEDEVPGGSSTTKRKGESRATTKPTTSSKRQSAQAAASPGARQSRKRS
jgi:transcriptional regulator with XRE-family HTH domain